MKRKLMIMGVIVLLIITNSIAAFANTETTVTLQSDKTEVKAGETFIVTLKATCPDGINGIETTYSYDEDVLELQSASVADNNFASLGIDNQITVISNATTSITSADVYKLTFIVKDGVEADTTTEISIAETLLDSDAATDSEHTIEAQEITIDIISGEDEDTPPADDGNDDEENPPVDDGNDDEENPPVDDGNEDEQPTTDGTTVVVGDDNQDQTTADKDIPKAGINSIILISIIVVAVIAFVIYNKNKSYKDIK